jgi:hypothetical protein
MVTFTINIPQMLAYIYHTWILWEWCFPNPITMPQPRTRSHWRLYPEMIRSKSQKAAELQQSHDVSKIQQWQTVQFYYWLYRMCIYILYVYNIYIYMYWSENSCKFYPIGSRQGVPVLGPCFWKSQTYHEQEMLQMSQYRVPIQILGVNKYWMNIEPQHGLFFLIISVDTMKNIIVNNIQSSKIHVFHCFSRYINLQFFRFNKK